MNYKLSQIIHTCSHGEITNGNVEIGLSKNIVSYRKENNGQKPNVAMKLISLETIAKYANLAASITTSFLI